MNQLVVAIRGTDWSFWLNWIQNFASVLPLVPFTPLVPSIGAGSPMIAVGTNLGLQALLSARGSTVAGASPIDVATFLKSVDDRDVFFTGHSLGGCLATVLAPTLLAELGSSLGVKVYTFAAPSAGNHDFADYFNRLFTDSRDGVSIAYRVFNDLDIVPSSWASLPEIAALYAPAPPCTQQMQSLIDWAQVRVAGEYAQVGSMGNGSAVLLRGQVSPPRAPRTARSFDNVAFFREVDYQHGTDMYQQLMGTPVTPPWLANLERAFAAVRS